MASNQEACELIVTTPFSSIYIFTVHVHTARVERCVYWQKGTRGVLVVEPGRFRRFSFAKWRIGMAAQGKRLLRTTNVRNVRNTLLADLFSIRH